MTTNNKYFAWLLKQVNADKDSTNLELYKFLYYRDFEWVMEQDANRAKDGEELRFRYMESCGIQPFELPELQTPCSVLEMLVALAKRCDFQTSTSYESDYSSVWFKRMIKNLGLNRPYFDSQRTDEILTNWMNRAYSKDGKGNIFYIPNYDGDMRTMEIWYQMCSYIAIYMDLSI